MKFLHPLLFILHLTATQALNELTQCDLKPGPTRIFHTPLEYQGTNSSFDPRHPTYRGNVVEITSLGAETLPKNFFVSFDSDHILKLGLHGQGATAVENGAFLGLFCLQELDLGDNNISALHEGSFEGLQNLRKLDLSGNALADVPDDGLIFVTLKSLKELNLSHNSIEHLKRLSFMAQAELETLDLSYNRLGLLPQGVFDYLAALRVLRLDHNRLSQVSVESWKGLTSLKSLNLSGNSLSAFDALAARRRFPALASLDLTGNSWACAELTVIRHFLADSEVVLSEPLTCSEADDVVRSRDIIQQVGETVLRTRLLERRLDSIHSVLVFLIAALSVSLAVYFAVKGGLCRRGCDRVTGANRRRGYLDNDETVLLTMR